MDEDDNVSSTLLRIDLAASKVTVLDPDGCPAAGGSVVVTGITPPNGKVGSKIQVTIQGSGFAPGMAVGFDGGSGAPPQLSNVVVVSSNQIRATMTIKKGKISRDPVWNVVVGSGVLSGVLFRGLYSYAMTPSRG